MNGFNNTHNNQNTSDFISNTLSNLAKRQARRDYFKRSLIVCCAVFALSLALGGVIYIHFSKSGYTEKYDIEQIPLPFSYGLKESVRKQLKLYALLCAPLLLQFASGFTLFAQYICIPTVSASGIICGSAALYFTSEIFTSSPSPRFTAYYILYILCGALYCAACVCIACVCMSFSASLRHNSKTASKLNEGDTAEYFSFFIGMASAILLLSVLRCVGLYAIALFK